MLQVSSTPAVDENGTVYIGSSDGNLYALIATQNSPSSSPITLTCPHGTEFAGEECTKCAENWFNNHSSTLSFSSTCKICPDWRTNIGDGNTACEYFAMKNEASLVMITVIGLYSLLTILAIVLGVKSGEGIMHLVTILGLASCQVVAIYNTSTATFKFWNLLILSSIFCFTSPILNLIVLVSGTPLHSWFVNRIYDKYSKSYFVGWVLHRNMGHQFTCDRSHAKAECKSVFIDVIYVLWDIIWPFIRLFIMPGILITGVITQLLFIICIHLAYACKLNSFGIVNDMIHSLWNDTYNIAFHIQYKSMTNYTNNIIFNRQVFCQALFECLPQIVIQWYNLYHLTHYASTRPPLPIVTITLSSYIVLSILVFIIKHTCVYPRVFKNFPLYRLIDLNSKNNRSVAATNIENVEIELY